jgi:glycosyltransferase involved in cell wall biosynthesis
VSSKSKKSFPDKQVWHLAYVTKFGVQKNFDILIDAVALLKQGKVDVCLHLTLNPELPECKNVLEQINIAGIKEIVVNHGEMTEEQVRNLYNNIDIFLFPSLCESFGFPLLEAMSQGIPLLVSDIASNIEIVGTDVFSFDPFDANALASKVKSLMDYDTYMDASEYMVKRSEEFSWKKAADQTLACLSALAKKY